MTTPLTIGRTAIAAVPEQIICVTGIACDGQEPRLLHAAPTLTTVSGANVGAFHLDRRGHNATERGQISDALRERQNHDLRPR